jgi:hypothetical protein
VIGVEPSTFVPIPTPRRTLDPIDVEHAEIAGEAIELALGWAVGRLHHACGSLVLALTGSSIRHLPEANANA